MAKDNIETTIPAAVNVATTDLRELIDAVRNDQQRKKRFGAPDFKPKSSFNKEGLYEGQGGRKFTRDYFQNGGRINIHNVTLHEIAGLEKLQAGKYFENACTVKITEGEGDTPDVVRITYRNKTHEDRINIAQKWRGLIGLLDGCNDEAEMRRLDADTKVK